MVESFHYYRRRHSKLIGRNVIDPMRVLFLDIYKKMQVIGIASAKPFFPCAASGNHQKHHGTNVV